MNGIDFIVAQAERMQRRPADRDTAVITLAKSMSQREIAVELGMSRSTVQYVLRKAREAKS